MSTIRTLILALAAVSPLVAADAALAQGRGRGDGSGPVGTACSKEIGQYCAGISHGRGAVRACLRDNSSKLSPPCKAALDSTGGGRR